MSERPDIARLARDASRPLASLSTAKKNAVLEAISVSIAARTPDILLANAKDMEAARASGLAPSKLKRLELTEKSLVQLAAGVRQIAALSDPVGQVTEERVVDSGLKVRRVRVPLGVIMMIYEARPGVTIDAFSLCLKAGNACILKGGREAARSNIEFVSLVHSVLDAHGLSRAALTFVPSYDESEMKRLLSRSDCIDLVIPRGGENLIRFVASNSQIPTLNHAKGVCHIFVDESAEQAGAIEVCLNSKISAPATCNAAECILVHEKIASEFLPKLEEALVSAGVEIRADVNTLALMKRAQLAEDGDFGCEFLDLIVAIKVVPDVAGAIEHIALFGSRHTEVILSASQECIGAFRAGVDASCVIANASTRFNDGFQLGLGAEIGISTSKLHAYGPMGLEELTTRRFEVVGNFQTR